LNGAGEPCGIGIRADEDEQGAGGISPERRITRATDLDYRTAKPGPSGDGQPPEVYAAEKILSISNHYNDIMVRP
jgi:hypothetical protein